MKLSAVVSILLVSIFLGACRTPMEWREQADTVSGKLIQKVQKKALGRTEPIQVETPSQTLRRRLMLDQGLARQNVASLGIRDIADDKYFSKEKNLRPAKEDPTAAWSAAVVELSLVQALQVAARNSREFQNEKNYLFRAALNLDLEKDEFRSVFTSWLQQDVQSAEEADGDRNLEGATSALVGIDHKFRNGVELSGSLVASLAAIITQDASTSLGLRADASVSMPLLRGSGELIVTENLTQAERNLLYEVYSFERYKRSFAVTVASAYYNVLLQKRKLLNQEENYKRIIASTRRARRLADSGRLPEFQFDQSIQDELRARQNWIGAQISHKRYLDAFKITLGLPPDANIVLREVELNELLGQAAKITAGMKVADYSGKVPSADAPVELRPPDTDHRGPLELDEKEAIELAFAKRLDLRVALARVSDARRDVFVAADALRAELTIGGAAQTGAGRGIGQARQDNAHFEVLETTVGGFLQFDLPFERTAERNTYRNSLLNYEEWIRAFQEAEDEVKLDVRNRLRELQEARESVLIQTQAVVLAERRVRSTNMFLQAGRAEIRDVLDAEDDLLSAQNSLSSALVDYRVSGLELQRDLGVLEVGVDGLCQEFSP